MFELIFMSLKFAPLLLQVFFNHHIRKIINAVVKYVQQDNNRIESKQEIDMRSKECFRNNTLQFCFEPEINFTRWILLEYHLFAKHYCTKKQVEGDAKLHVSHRLNRQLFVEFICCLIESQKHYFIE